VTARVVRFAATCIAIWLAIQIYTHIGSKLYGMQIAWGEVFALATIRALLWALLTPLILALVQRFPVAAPHRLRNLVLILMSIPLLAATNATISVALTANTFTWARVARQTVAPNILLTGLAVLIAHVVHVRQAAAEREQRQLELEALLARTQTEQLRGRLSPSFLFAALGGITAAIERDPVEAERLLVALAELLRSAMDFHKEGEISLEDELEFVDRYLELQPSATQLRIEVDEHALRAWVPPFIVQTFIEPLACDATGPITIRGWLAGAARQRRGSRLATRAPVRARRRRPL
jgi:two-component system LytT family sensor kinase